MNFLLAPLVLKRFKNIRIKRKGIFFIAPIFLFVMRKSGIAIANVDNNKNNKIHHLMDNSHSIAVQTKEAIVIPPNIITLGRIIH